MGVDGKSSLELVARTRRVDVRGTDYQVGVGTMSTGERVLLTSLGEGCHRTYDIGTDVVVALDVAAWSHLDVIVLVTGCGLSSSAAGLTVLRVEEAPCVLNITVVDGTGARDEAIEVPTTLGIFEVRPREGLLEAHPRRVSQVERGIALDWIADMEFGAAVGALPEDEVEVESMRILELMGESVEE
jgi:hypothetical protein